MQGPAGNRKYTCDYGWSRELKSRNEETACNLRLPPHGGKSGAKRPRPRPTQGFTLPFQAALLIPQKCTRYQVFYYPIAQDVNKLVPVIVPKNDWVDASHDASETIKIIRKRASILATQREATEAAPVTAVVRNSAQLPRAHAHRVFIATKVRQTPNSRRPRRSTVWCIRKRSQKNTPHHGIAAIDRESTFPPTRPPPEDTEHGVVPSNRACFPVAYNTPSGGTK